MLKIGVSACFLYPDADRNLFKTKQLNYLENDMASYLARKNAMPILIPDIPEDHLECFFMELDGLVLQGGADIAPASYNEVPIGHWKGDAYRDAYELKLIDKAVKQKKPILGICRGMQLLNVYFGGTLYQDIQTQHEGALKHRDAGRYDRLAHVIEFTEGGKLEQLYSNHKQPVVNSVHHQGVKELGKGMITEAKSSADGIIEAIAWTGADLGKVYGVQWHPEFSATLGDQLIPAAPLYDMFLGHC